MDSLPLNENHHQIGGLLSRYHHIAHYTGTALRIATDETSSRSSEIAIEGYSSSMVELAKLALQQALLQQSALGRRGGGGGVLVQQAAVASTSEGGGGEMPPAPPRSKVGIEGGRKSKVSSSPLVEEDAVSSTTECEPLAANAAVASVSLDGKPPTLSKGWFIMLCTTLPVLQFPHKDFKNSRDLYERIQV
jgi:hypothetical protein